MCNPIPPPKQRGIVPKKCVTQSRLLRHLAPWAVAKVRVCLVLVVFTVDVMAVEALARDIASSVNVAAKDLFEFA